ncbi:hypothetical protein CRI77_03500 [Mycolicibacterium duvalii]|uniref:Uncharacterized protein n=1 Tax=Mycolicibacterium duvalii TaxID=39688 RepID=A0A7I7KAL2_9MYCO|nr:hypothetical protein [Mycolicibacterium duvalii]MCV7366560.1 hypothetical protein [Mycolicibacterium duvalii]PEG43666.1 hypothetical protein CRI77_03500 [Mycolicibacterium duvalii]BBX20392.1 hypothetical protein MDUV_52520 [Mycolicibacterium duvalii]
MKARLSSLAALLVAGGAAAAIAAAPAALAQPSCTETGQGGGMEGGSTTVCESPGNVQIDSRPSVYAPGPMGGMFPWDYGMFIL